MIDLKKFPKLGVRVPALLKRKVRQLALDLETEGIGFQGEAMTMEAIFAVAALGVLSLPKSEQRELFERAVPDLIAMFEAESGAKETPGEAGGERGEDVDLGSGGTLKPPVVYPDLGKAGRPKRA